MVEVYLTEGFGNNLFQAFFGKIIAEKNCTDLSLIPPTANYFGISPLKALGFDISFSSKIRHDFVSITDLNSKEFLSLDNIGCDVKIFGYFEDFTFFSDRIDSIRSSVPQVEQVHKNDLVIHLRLGDRIVYKNHYGTEMMLDADKYINATKSFDYENLYIVTDLDSWAHKTPEDIESMSFHIDVPSCQRVDPRISSDYVNGLVDGFSSYSPIVKCGDTSDILSDFNLIRSFGNILGLHSTFFWWAAVLSYAKKIGVYSKWRPVKGSGNKNLGKTNYPGWFHWS